MQAGGEEEETERVYEKALEVDPNDPTTLANYGHWLHTVAQPSTVPKP